MGALSRSASNPKSLIARTKEVNLNPLADPRMRIEGGSERGMPDAAAGGNGRRVLARVANRVVALALLLSLAQPASVEAFSFPSALRAPPCWPGRMRSSLCGARATMAPPNKIPGGGGGGAGIPTYPFNIPGMMQRVGDGKVGACIPVRP